MTYSAGTASRPRTLSPAVALALFGVLAATALLIVKWWPYGAQTVTVAGTHAWEGTSVLGTVEGPSWRAGWDFLTGYGASVWPALVAAIVIGAAVESLVPRQRILRALGGRGTLRGTLLAVPSMMCTCCTAPIVNSLRRSGASTRSAVAYWLGNPVLNPFVLVFLLLVGPWQWGATRFVVGLLVVVAVAALAGRFAPTPQPGALDAVRAADEIPPGRRFARAVGRFALVLVPEYAIFVFAVGAVRGWLLPLDPGSAPVLLAVLVAAVLGVLIVLPTAGEIPVLLALGAAGVAPAVAGALLITLPAVSLPSMMMVGRSLSWRITALAGGGVAAGGLLAAGLLTVLS